MTAFSEALALESASDCTYNEDTGTYILTANDMVRYAKIVAYKVAQNLRNGHELDPDNDPLEYVDCEDYPPLDFDDLDDSPPWGP